MCLVRILNERYQLEKTSCCANAFQPSAMALIEEIARKSNKRKFVIEFESSLSFTISTTFSRAKLSFRTLIVVVKGRRGKS